LGLSAFSVEEMLSLVVIAQDIEDVSYYGDGV
jgi:hypothetical protein